MLEFIVLGQVPGTSVQLNLAAIISIAIGLYLLSRSLSTFYHYHRFKGRFGHVARYLVLTNKKSSKKARARA